MSSFFTEVQNYQVGPTTYESTQYLGTAKGTCCNNNIASTSGAPSYNALSSIKNSCDDNNYSSASNKEVVCGMTLDNLLAKQSYWSAGGMSEQSWAAAKNESCNRCPAVTMPSFPPANGFPYPHLDKANPTFNNNYPQTITDRPEVSTCGRPDSPKSQMSYGIYQGPATMDPNILLENTSPLDGEPREIYGDTFVATGSPHSCSSSGSGPNNLFVKCENSAALPWQTAAPSQLMWNPMPINNFLKSNYEVLKNNKSLAKITANAILNDSLSNTADLNTKLYRNVLSGDDPFMIPSENTMSCNTKAMSGNVFKNENQNQNQNQDQEPTNNLMKKIIIESNPDVKDFNTDANDTTDYYYQESNQQQTNGEQTNQGSINLNDTNLTNIPNQLVYGSNSCCNVNNYNVADPIAPEEMPYVLKKSLFNTNQIKNPYGNSWTGSINNHIGVPYASTLHTEDFNCVANEPPMIQNQIPPNTNYDEIKQNQNITLQDLNQNKNNNNDDTGIIYTFIEAWKTFFNDINTIQNNKEYALSSAHKQNCHSYGGYIFTTFAIFLFIIFLFFVIIYLCIKK